MNVYKVLSTVEVYVVVDDGEEANRIGALGAAREQKYAHVTATLVTTIEDVAVGDRDTMPYTPMRIANSEVHGRTIREWLAALHPPVTPDQGDIA